MNLWRQDKGQAACARAFVEAVRTGGEAPIPAGELLEVARVSIELQRVVDRHPPLPGSDVAIAS